MQIQADDSGREVVYHGRVDGENYNVDVSSRALLKSECRAPVHAVGRQRTLTE